MKLAEITTLVNQVEDVAESKRSTNTFVVILDQVVQDAEFYLKIQPLQFLFEQRSKLGFGRIKDLNFVMNSPQKRFVAQRRWFEIG